MTSTPVIFVASMFLLSSAHAAAAKRPQVEPSTLPEPAAGEYAAAKTQPLSTVMDLSLTGLEFEPAEYQTSVHARAAEYILLRSKPAKPGRSAFYKKALAECNAAVSKHPFCALIENPDLLRKARVKSERRRAPRQKLHVIRGLLKKADVAQLESADEKSIRAAFRELRSFERLKNVTAALLDDSQKCTAPKLAFLLATKAEEFLPDPEIRQTAISLYSRSAECEHPQTPQALYRLSLLQIWAGDCSAAVPHLEKLAADASIRDYRSRALFWKAECGGKLGAKEVTASARRALFDEHPFSLHTLLAQVNSIPQFRSTLAGTDSTIRFRSANHPELNDLVTASEALLLNGQSRMAEGIVGAIASQAGDAEPEFQLYVAYLLDQVGDFLGKFRLMSQLLQDNPKLVSWSSLALYYPRTELKTEIIRNAGLDELLVLSLIRQESAFNQKARSRAGARGLMQVMPATARLVEKRRISSRELFNPEINLKIGSKYFSFLIKRYNGDAELALAAYNAGPIRVEEWLKRYPVENRVLFLDLVPFRETREYVASIARNFFWYSLLYSVPAMEPAPPLAPAAAETAKQSAEPAPFPGTLRNVFRLFGG